ncbi:Heterogeneous nuclear ribonucleoproteins A1-like protein [Acropora cervicornis]|uniref:Heterogeneous nuclear ribonucleoproteins A1-like protein n=1 Tax=Acropora cervicornis TaxID=6130 RepID=A0AAD9QFF1_ACRCE|nr:Heterogeneous nuclear ribonucleoproteins A1-like protein [Acropora cervicornis]
MNAWPAEVLNHNKQHLIDGKAVDPKPAAPINKPPHLRVKKIFVGGLKPDTTSDHQIREYFKQYAPVKDIEYVTEHLSKKKRVKRALPKEVQQQQAALRAAVAGRGMIPAIATAFGVVPGRARATTGLGRGAGGINLAAYNPTYAAALYGAAFGTSGSYDPTLYAASYPGLPTAFPAYSPGSAFATAAAAASAEYPRGAYALPYSPGREPSIHLPVTPSKTGTAVSTKSLTLHHMTDTSELIGSFLQQGNGVMDRDDIGSSPFRIL